MTSSDSAHILLVTDLVDSTRWSEQIGDDEATRLWARHDRLARELIAGWRGREIDKSDGFLVLFDCAADALHFAEAYGAMLAAMQPPLAARTGIHRGALTLRVNPREHVDRGAKPLDVDGIAKAVAARIMSVAEPSQILASAALRADLPEHAATGLKSHGFWRLKGLRDPIELFAASNPSRATQRPVASSAKGWQVVRLGDIWVPVTAVANNLPAERDCFVGRRTDLDELWQRFEDGARLVTLLGTGGTGKTRLALRHGWERLAEHPGGVWFCDLSAATSVDGVVHAMAQALQLTLAAPDPVRQIGEAIAGRGDCLLVLDNFEQVARHAESTVGHWLGRAAQARLLVTSREVLGIAGENTFVLAPLPAADAQLLLRDRAAAAGADAFTSRDDAALPELVRLLDGLPLAIELAASRMRVLPPAELLPRMGERFRLLAGGQGRRDRQATLRATLDWSWDLLSQAERGALAQLSVFEGSFTLGAAESVVDLSAFDQAPWLLDVVQSLVDKSLVRKLGDRRFDLLRSVHDYAVERLQQDNAAASAPGCSCHPAGVRHWCHFSRYGELESTAQRCIEVDNLVAAARRAIDAADLDHAAGCVCAAWFALRLTGPFSTALELAASLGAKAAGHRIAAASAAWVSGNANYLLGHAGAARALLEQALADAGDDRGLRCRMLCTLGTAESVHGDPQRATAWLQEALVLARAIGDRPSICRAMNALGALADAQSHPSQARQWYEAALEVAGAAGDPRWQGALLGNLGQVHFRQGDLESATTCYGAALLLVRESGDLRFEGNTRCNLGLVHQEMGRFELAEAELGAALQIARGIGQ